MGRKRQDSSGASKPKKKAAAKPDQGWFRRKVAELKAELEKLPADRQAQLSRELGEGREH